jgi:hypothetical protein
MPVFPICFNAIGVVTTLCVGLLAGTSLAVAQPSPSLLQKSEQAAEVVALAQREGHVSVIVQFEPPVPPSQIGRDAASVASAQAQVAAVQETIIASHFGSATNPRAGVGFERGLTRFSLTPGFAINVNAAELEALAADPRVLRIQYNRADRPSLLESLPLIGMPQAYNLGANGGISAVAVLDTGISAGHEFFVGKIVKEACFSTVSSTATSLCPNGTNTQTTAGAANIDNVANCLNGTNQLCAHGSHVAGIAAGLNSNRQVSEPINGVSRFSGIFAIQVFSRFNGAAQCNPDPAPCVRSFAADQIRALDHVRANIVLPDNYTVAAANISIGGAADNAGNCDTDTRKAPIDSLRAAGVLTTIAAGNNSSTNMISAPGCISSAITVGSTTKADALSGFTNMSTVVDLLAPGSSILSSVPPGVSNYQSFNGTSMAAPHVAGAIAAMLSVCTLATVDQVEAALKVTGKPIADARSGGTVTRNRIRVDLALQQLCGNQLARPSNDNFSNALNYSSPGAAIGRNVNATKEAGEPNHANNQGGKSVWWRFAATINDKIRITTAGTDFDPALAVYTGNAVNALTLVAQAAGSSGQPAEVSFNGVAGTTYWIAVDGFVPINESVAPNGNIRLNLEVGVAAVLAAVAPNARTTTINTPVTGFATMINNGNIPATSCSISLPLMLPSIPATFMYQTTNPSTNTPTGTANTPVNIPAGGSQTFFFAITPTAAFSRDIALVFDCSNTDPAPIVLGLNTFLVTASTTAITDMLSIADTLSHDGIVNIPGVSGTGLMVTAAVDIGAGGTVTCAPTPTPVGQTARALPATLTICQTNNQGQCINPVTPAASSTLGVATNQTVFFSTFIQAQGQAIPFDPANTRVFFICTQGGTPVGEASVAVRTQ